MAEYLFPNVSYRATVYKTGGLLKMLHKSILQFSSLLLYWKLKPKKSISHLQKLLSERSINTYTYQYVFDNRKFDSYKQIKVVLIFVNKIIDKSSANGR